MKNLVNKFVLTNIRLAPFQHAKSDPMTFDALLSFEKDIMIFIESCVKRDNRYDLTVVKDFKYYLLRGVKKIHFRELE